MATLPGLFLKLKLAPWQRRNPKNVTNMEKVELILNDSLRKDESVFYPVAQAEKILQLQAKGKKKNSAAYSLPEKSKYEFKDNALRPKSNKPTASATA